MNVIASDDVELADRRLALDPLEPECAEVQGLPPTGDDPLCEPSPDGWCLLEPVT